MRFVPLRERSFKPKLTPKITDALRSSQQNLFTGTISAASSCSRQFPMRSYLSVSVFSNLSIYLSMLPCMCVCIYVYLVVGTLDSKPVTLLYLFGEEGD